MLISLYIVALKWKELTGYLSRDSQGIKRKVVITRPVKDLRTLVEVTSTNANDYAGKSKEDTEAEVTLLSQFVDFLDKALHLNPEKRLTVREALVQPFINISSTS